MNTFFRRHQDALLLIALLTLSMLLLLGTLRQKPALSVVERLVITVFAPFQNAVSWLAFGITDTADHYLFLVNKAEENIFLREEVDRLAFENNILTERLKFYQRLEALLTFNNPAEYPIVAASAIGRDTTGRARMITINRGTSHGLAKGMPVVSERGLLGRIVLASPLASKTLLITDTRSGIDAIMQRTREQLVVEGYGGPTLKSRYLAIDADVRPGDKVVSSGLGGIFPKGLLIGQIAEVIHQRDSLFLTATIRPAAELNRIEEVLVIVIMPDADSKSVGP